MKKSYPGSRAGLGYLDATIRRLPATIPPGDLTPEQLAQRAAAGAEERLYEVSASSEYEVVRSFLGLFTWREVLDHSPESVQLGRFQSGRANFLADHDPRQPIGVIRSARLDSDLVLRTSIAPGTSDKAVEVFRDVDAEVRTSSSVGYIPKRAVLVEEDEERGDLWRIELWEPVELSSVTIPADPTVGVGRDMIAEARAMGYGTYLPVEVRDGRVKGERTMKKVRGENGAVVEVADDDPRAAIRDDAQPAARVEDLRAAEVERMETIREAGALNRIDNELTTQWIRDGLSVRDVFKKILEIRKTQGEHQPGSEQLGDEALAKRYSYSKLVLQLGDGGKLDGAEREMHEEILVKNPALRRNGGYMIPLRRGQRGGNLGGMMAPQTRTLQANTGGKGAELVSEERGELIDLLRNQTAVIRLGARVLTGLTSPVAFPKRTGAMTAQWLGEGQTVTASDVAFALAHLIPKRLAATTGYSRDLLIQSGLDAEGIVVDDLAAIDAIAIDLAAIHGLAAAGEPTGIYKAVGVSATAVGGAMSYAKVVAMEGQVATANALLGSLGWLMNPTMSANLKQVMKTGNTNAYAPVWEGPITEGNVDGYRAIASNQVSKTMTGSERTGGTEIGSVFGNWSDLLVGLFGAMEVIVDPYSAKKQGIIEVTSFHMADVLARHGESFSKSTGATG